MGRYGSIANNGCAVATDLRVPSTPGLAQLAVGGGLEDRRL